MSGPECSETQKKQWMDVKCKLEVGLMGPAEDGLWRVRVRVRKAARVTSRF